jgi:hypothetical protein
VRQSGWSAPVDLTPNFEYVDTSWQKYAACAGADLNLFFPARGESRKKAKEYCDVCPVETECLIYRMLTNTEYGFWGGRMVPRKKKADSQIATAS